MKCIYILCVSREERKKQTTTTKTLQSYQQNIWYVFFIMFDIPGLV